jgi:hypothetical protein
MLISRAMYGAALPTGEFVAQVPGEALHTHHGPVPLPPGEMWGLQFFAIAPGKFAGLAHDAPGRIWEWDGAWNNRSSLFESGRCAYVNGELADMAPAGIGYVDDAGQPVSFIHSHDPHDGIELSQWSETAGLRIGQPHQEGESGVLVYDGKDYRRLDTGPCNEIKVHRDGERIAITYRKDGDGIYSRVWTLRDLRSLPIVGTTVPDPGPPPPPEPIRMEAKRLPDDVHAIVVALHARHLTLAKGSDDDRRILQQKICETVRARKGDRWGWKSNHGIGIANAKDAIAELPAGATFTPNDRQPLYIWDLFNGSTRDPNAQPVMSETNNVEQFFVPVEPIDHLADAPVPPPPAPPPPAPVEDWKPAVARLQQDVAALTARLKELRENHDATYHLALALNDRLTALENTPVPTYQATGTTSREWGHAHKISVTLEPHS